LSNPLQYYLDPKINRFNTVFNLWYEKNKKKAYFDHFLVRKNDEESFTFLAIVFRGMIVFTIFDIGQDFSVLSRRIWL